MVFFEKNLRWLNDFMIKEVLFKSNLKIQKHNWDWVVDSKDFLSTNFVFEGDFSFYDFRLVPAFEVLKWEKTNFLLSLKLEKEISGKRIFFKVAPDFYEFESDEFLNQTAVLLNRFPPLSHDTYKDFAVGISGALTSFQWMAQISHKETHNFFYVDESKSTGEFKFGHFRRMEILNRLKYKKGIFAFEGSAFYRRFSDFPAAPRFGFELKNSLGWKRYLIALKFLFNSKTEYRKRFLNSGFSFCYNLRKNFDIFVEAMNILGSEIFYAPKRSFSSPVFAGGILIKW